MIPRLTDMVSACKGVVEHRGKLCGELSEGGETSSPPASVSSLTR